MNLFNLIKLVNNEFNSQILGPFFELHSSRTFYTIMTLRQTDNNVYKHNLEYTYKKKKIRKIR